jgi:curved DNA-binding protein CbpA
MTDLYDPQSRAAVRAWIEQQYEEMQRASYYQLLDVARNANEAEVRDEYYKRVARFHPDLYVNSLDDHTRDKLVTMYSRIVEAYQCLTNGARRARYDQLLLQGRLRWTPEDERAPAPRAEDAIQNPHAQRLFRLAQENLRQGNPKGALMNLKMALSAEPENSTLQTEIAKAEAALKKG